MRATRWTGADVPRSGTAEGSGVGAGSQMNQDRTEIRARLRYLGAKDVAACLPGPSRQLELATMGLLALARDDAEMPPKTVLRLRTGCQLEAMPCWHKTAGLVGIKWVAESAMNQGRGLPAVHALLVLNAPDTGIPTWIMDASAITAVRTAAVTGAAVRALAPPTARRAAIIGAGVQGRSHLRMLGSLLPGITISAHDRDPERAEAFATWARGQQGIGSVQVRPTGREAVSDAEIVVTAAALGSMSQVMQPDWLPPECLVVALDDDTYVSATLAASAERFVVDDRPQFLAYRAHDSFKGYPDPAETLGEVIGRGSKGSPQARGRVLVTSIGVAVVDILFAEEVRKIAEGRGLGIELER